MPRLTMAERFYSKTLTRNPDRSGVIPNYISFSEIDWKSIKPIGAGGYNAVFRNNRYAVKIGSVTDGDAMHLSELAQSGIGIPVYGYWKNLVIPQWFVTKWKRIRSYAREESFTSYLDFGFDDVYRANVLIVARAKPAVNHKDWKHYAEKYDTDRRYIRIKEDQNNLYKAVREAGSYWTDDHAGNFGYWRGKPVVLDV